MLHTLIIRKPGRPVGQSDVLTFEEMLRMASLPDRRTKEGARDYAVLLLLANTPMRKGELVSLKVGNVLDEGNKTFITYEGLKKISEKKYWLKIPVDRSVYDAIMRCIKNEYRKAKLPADAPLFLTLGKHGPHKKRALTPSAVDWIVSKYVRLAEIKKRITPHSFRASYLTMRSQGRDPVTLMGLSGHASMRSIMPYIRSNEEKRREAALAFSVS